MNAVKACPLDPADFAARFAETARARGFRGEPFAEAGGVPLVAYTKRTPGPLPRIYLSAGVHGDEPAAPLAMLSLLERGVFDSRATWFLCPLINPTGFRLQTRENGDGLDLNRDYLDTRSAEVAGHIRWLRRQPAFDLVFCLHEDWEAKGFYLYELNDGRTASLADAILAASGPYLPIDQSDVIDGRAAAAPGIIRPVSDPLLRDTWPEAIYLRAKHCSLNYTLETPSGFPVARRISALAEAVEAGISCFLKARASR